MRKQLKDILGPLVYKSTHPLDIEQVLDALEEFVEDRHECVRDEGHCEGYESGYEAACNQGCEEGGVGDGRLS